MHVPSHAEASPRCIDALLAQYAVNHQNAANVRLHLVCIPAILFSLIGLLYAVHPWAAAAFVGASLVYYARLSIVFLATMVVVGVLVFAALRALGPLVLPVSIALFVAGWIGQFVGHRIEGRKPSFLEDLRFLWIGPLFCLTHLFRPLGIRW